MSRRRSLGGNRSGQLLIVAALAIALLISSTTIYVYELSKGTEGTDGQSIGGLVLALKQSTRNAVLSSLANVSNGGERTMLTTNLNKLSEVFRNLHSLGLYGLGFGLLNDSIYDSGIRISWNTTTTDVSSACVNFTLSIDDATAHSSVAYGVNVTTSLVVDGSHVIEGTEERVNLTCRVHNEGEPALARNFNLYYEHSGSWAELDSSTLITSDYGNGTYLLSFAVPSESTRISVHMSDMRGILVQSLYNLA